MMMLWTKVLMMLSHPPCDPPQPEPLATWVMRAQTSCVLDAMTSDAVAADDGDRVSQNCRESCEHWEKLGHLDPCSQFPAALKDNNEGWLMMATAVPDLRVRFQKHPLQYPPLSLRQVDPASWHWRHDATWVRCVSCSVASYCPVSKTCLGSPASGMKSCVLPCGCGYDEQDVHFEGNTL